VSAASFYLDEIFFIYSLFIYYRTGRVNNIKIRDDNNPNDVRNFSNAKLQLSERPTPKIIITLPADDEVLIFYTQILILQFFL
jgi:hypothetical protein